MSLVQQIQAINEGLFDRNYPPDQLVQVLDNGTQRVVNWRRVRPAIEALADMPWYQLDRQWEFFLDPGRYPAGQQLDLRPDEVETFQNLVQNVVNQTREGVRILSSVQPEVSLLDVSVSLDVKDLPTLAEAMTHIQKTTEIAAIDDAITISSLQPGSLEVFLTAGRVSLYGLQLAIILAKMLKDPSTTEKVRTLKRLWRRARPDDDVTDEAVLEAVHGEAKENFWENATESLRVAVDIVGKNLPESKNKIDLAANEIYQRADSVSADWKLPPAVISGLPGGLTVALNLESPESIGRVIRAISATPENEDSNS